MYMFGQNKTLNVVSLMIANGHYDAAFRKLSSSVIYKTSYREGGNKVQVVGGKIEGVPWVATRVNSNIDRIELLSRR